MSKVYVLVYNCILFKYDLSEGKSIQLGVIVSLSCMLEKKIF